MLRDIKITKCERNKKTERRKEKFNHLTPEKITSRESTYNSVARLEKKYGYDYENVDDCQLLRRMREEFRMKAAEYCGGRTFKKKQTRFDKMKAKEELGFELKMNPVVTNFKKADKILQKLVLCDALYKIKKY